MKKYNKIAIIGVGLLGGSIGLAVKRRKLAREVVGICRREISLRRALARGACDRVTLNFRDGIKGADLVIIATPVGKIVDMARNVIRYSDGDMILTDVGSTKADVVGRINRMVTRNIKFVGSHPMAGSEKSGVKFADGNLFKGSVCIVTKSPGTDKAALNMVMLFWKSLGAILRVLSPEEHDSYIAYISHLPHMAAAALVNSAGPKSLEYSSTGFKDTTRIASSDPELWHDIFMTNRQAVSRAVSGYSKCLSDIAKSIESNNSGALLKLLKKAKKIRDAV